jgi:hypothetical protein
VYEKDETFSSLIYKFIKKVQITKATFGVIGRLFLIPAFL